MENLIVIVFIALAVAIAVAGIVGGLRSRKGRQDRDLETVGVLEVPPVASVAGAPTVAEVEAIV